MSPFEKLWVRKNNQIVKSPFEKDYNSNHTLYPFKKGLRIPSVLSWNNQNPAVLFGKDFTSSSPQPPSNRKPFPQEENPMTILPAVLFQKD